MPAVYPTLLAGIAGPVRERKGVETTLATQPEPSGAARLSLTTTSPRLPLTVAAFAEFPRLPRLRGAVLTLISSAPPVTVTVAVLVPVSSAEAGTAIPSVMSPAAVVAASRRGDFMIVLCPRGLIVNASLRSWC
ncbi:MAG: hypothetical protein H0T91_06920 [Propionibacteriaceae bacterium]|nr:hypothetical protein [Propionibacteriaceae bacterium]